MAVAIGWREMVFSERLRHGVVVVDEDERAVAKSLSSEGIDNRHDAAIVNMFPLLDTSYRSRVAQTKSCRSLALTPRISRTSTFESAQNIVFTILLLSLVDPTWETKDSSALVVISVQWD
jgi:hypothetical protein